MCQKIQNFKDKKYKENILKSKLSQQKIIQITKKKSKKKEHNESCITVHLQVVEMTELCYDDLLLKLGEFGPWQRKAIFWLLLPTFVAGLVSV